MKNTDIGESHISFRHAIKYPASSYEYVVLNVGVLLHCTISTKIIPTCMYLYCNECMYRILIKVIPVVPL